MKSLLIVQTPVDDRLLRLRVKVCKGGLRVSI